MTVAAHPGGTNTNLQDEMFSPWYMKPLMPLMRLMMQDNDMGALPTLRAAADPMVTGGEYYGPGGFREIVGNPVLVKSNEASHNQEDARRLWEVSEELTGVSFL